MAHKQAWSVRTQVEFFYTVKAVYRWAVKRGLLTSNPLAELVVPPRPRRGDETIITEQEYNLLLDQASPHFRTYLELLWETGARPGEIASIEAQHLDHGQRIVRLAEHKTQRHGHDRIIYLTARAYALLSELAEHYPTGWIVRAERGYRWKQDIREKRMVKLRQQCNLPHVTLYGFRHSFATRCLAQGIPDAIVAQLLGHSNTTMLHKHYSHLGSQYKVMQQWLEKMSE